MHNLISILLISGLALCVNLFWACDDGGDKKENTVTLCTDGVDNDGDDLIDCFDPHCETACASLDADADGVPDHLDACPGFDDALDADNDGVPDGCDICADGRDQIDRDRDGVPDDCDACEGYDDRDDADGDTVPNACEVCDGHDDRLDADGDGWPDGCDTCDGFDDNLDADYDGIPDDCDDCPMTFLDCNLCDQACEYTLYTCESWVCVPSVFDCTTEDDFCESACILDAPCGMIATLTSQAPDPDLAACLDACEPNNTCFICTENRCIEELDACRQDTVCTDYLICIDACPDANCLDACHETHRSDSTTYMGMCLWDECEVACKDLFAYPQ